MTIKRKHSTSQFLDCFFRAIFPKIHCIKTNHLCIQISYNSASAKLWFLRCVWWASKETSLFQSDIHWNPLHLNDSFLDTDKVILSLLSTSKKTKVYFSQRGDKSDEIARGQFSKIIETACLSGWEFEADNSPNGIYVTCHWNWMNSYWMFWIGCLRGASSELALWAVSVIFEKWPFVI